MKFTLFAASLAGGLAISSASFGAPIYSENFDVDPTASWTTNNNGIGTNDANFFFDYSTVGIPSAPGSSGGTTRGLRLRANIGTAPASGIPGISASPTGLSIAGNQKLKFDWWTNYIGPLDVGAAGSTMLSTFGVQTSGTVANFAGSADSVFFAATGDGQSAADYRAYAPEKPTGYIVSAAPPDSHATYAAGSTNSSNAFYAPLFPAGQAAPAGQLPPAFGGLQTLATAAGSAGFRWHRVEIEKGGNLYTWKINGTLIATVDGTAFGTPVGGSNILFGYSDTNSTNNANVNFPLLQFSLIDNVEVVPEPASLALCLMAGFGLLFGRRRS